MIECAAMPDVPETKPSSSSSRRLANVFIVAFLAYQIAMPLRYYLGGRGYDERFSWRMFSSLRLQQCNMRIEEANGSPPRLRAVSVRQDVQAAWVALLERVRMPVVEKYLARRCESAGASEVSYTRSCTDAGGLSLPTQKLIMTCADRSLRGVEP
jgi:hypothetical protein